MTLQNGLIEGGKVYLYCDTAVFEANTRKQIGCYAKAIQSLNMPFAIACSFVGATNLPATMDRLLQAVTALPVDGAEGLANASKAWLLHWQASTGGTARLLIGSNFEGEGPRLVMLATDDLGFAKPFQAVTVEAFVSSANETDAYAAFARSHNRRAQMPALIDVQHATPMPTVDGSKPGLFIGGAAIEIAISPHGVESTVVRDWNQEAQL